MAQLLLNNFFLIANHVTTGNLFGAQISVAEIQQASNIYP
jgi:hypothetical protein